jgi:hypothetical protein
MLAAIPFSFQKLTSAFEGPTNLFQMGAKDFQLNQYVPKRIDQTKKRTLNPFSAEIFVYLSLD